MLDAELLRQPHVVPRSEHSLGYEGIAHFETSVTVNQPARRNITEVLRFYCMWFWERDKLRCFHLGDAFVKSASCISRSKATRRIMQYYVVL